VVINTIDDMLGSISNEKYINLEGRARQCRFENSNSRGGKGEKAKAGPMKSFQREKKRECAKYKFTRRGDA
jgi:hypothetical protein